MSFRGRSWSLTAVTALLFVPALASAQTPEAPAATAAPDATETTVAKKSAEETISVTGSRVRRKDLTSAAPIAVISREQIASSGIASVGDFLQQLPEQGGSENTNVNNGGDGTTQISLRNLGANRTLVLVDGKRFVAGGSGAGASADLNTIPTAAIERIEILKDGASAVYGSDAIGGVVNIITRKRANGTEASVYTGISPHGDANVTDFNLTSGTTSDKGSFLISGGYYKQDTLFAGARGWSTHALSYDYATGKISPGGSPTVPSGTATVNLDPATCTTALCAALRTKGGYSGKVTLINNGNTKDAAADPAVEDPSRPGSFWRKYIATGANTDAYNFEPINYLQTPSNRVSLFANGDYHIGNVARAYIQGSFVNRQSSYQLANEPLSSGAFGPIGQLNPFNPFGQDITAYRRRIVEAPGRGAAFDLSTIRIVGGMDGSLPSELGPLAGTFWDVSFNYGRTSGVTTYKGSVNTNLTAQGIAGNCGTAANPTTCVNVFAGQGAMTPDMLTALGFYDGVSNGWAQSTSLQANLSKELFTLASDRPVGIAAGYEFRREYGGFQPDPIGVQGFSFDFNSLPTAGSYNVNEGYAELVVPVVSNMTGIDDLEVSAAARVFKYSTFGSDATYKFGARYRPIRDVTIRGTYSTAFRAPAVGDLFGGQAPSAEVASDPCAGKVDAAGTIVAFDPVKDKAIIAQCGGIGSVALGGPVKNGNDGLGNRDPSQQINSTVGGNPKLTPEKATIETVGVVFEPSMLKGFTATVDFWNVSLTQTLGTLGTNVILSGCYPAATGSTDAPNQNLCNQISRNATNGQIFNVNDTELNVGTLTTNGIDFSARYSLPTDFGRFGLMVDATYLLKYESNLPGRTTPISAAGNYDAGSGLATGGVTPKLKFNVGLNYGLEAFNAGLHGRFIGGFDECAAPGGTDLGGLCSDHNTLTNTDGSPGAEYAHHSVSAYMTWDAIVSYMLKNPAGNTTLSVGMRNIFDTNPPVVYDSFLTFADPTYDFAGRYVYGRITHQF